MNAASVSIRRKRWARKIAQKIIISHIRNFLGSILWGSEHVGGVTLPTYEDYQYLLSVLQFSGKLEYESVPFESLVLIPIPNTYVLRVNKILHEKKRPEDERKGEVPREVYLVARESDLWEDRKHKCKKDFKKFITQVRAISLIILAKDCFSNYTNDSKIDMMDMRARWKKAGYSEREITKFIGKNKIKRKLGRPKKITQSSKIITDYFGNNRENFDKTLERLRKMQLAL